MNQVINQDTATDFEALLLKEVSRSLLMAYTTEIAKEVRLSGSEEELRAFEYAKRLLESWGLETQLTFHDAYISLPEKASLSLGSETFECITHSMGKSVDRLQAEAIYIHKNVYDESIAVKGKIVVLEGSGRANPGDTKWLAGLGAAGVVFVSNGQYIHEMIVSPVWGNPIPQTVGLLPAIPVISVNNESGELIKRRIEEGILSCTMSAEVDTRYRPIPTLVAEIKGQEQPEKYVLVSGHIDSWHLGVMDNGTANATTLEVARVLAKHKDKLKRSVKFAMWSGHSHGRYAGSAYYCDRHWEDLTENCVIHVNVDSTGATGATDVTHGHCLFETRDIAKGPIKAITGQDFEGVRLGRAGDHSFWGTGTPSLFMSLSTQPPEGNVIGGLGWWWHTTEDTLDKIDPAHLERDTRIYLLVCYRLLTAPVIPLNQLAAVEQLEAGLSDLQTKAGDRLDLSTSLRRVARLKENTTQLQALFGNLKPDEAEILHLANDSIMSLSRVLMQLLYVKGSIYDHDLAVQTGIIPKLAEIEQLAAAERDSDEYRIVKTYLTRRCNEVNDLLNKAIGITRKTIDYLY